MEATAGGGAVVPGRPQAPYRPDWDEYFMLQAALVGLRSNCVTRKVGAVIAKDRRQVATGYNGTPAGMPNCHEGGCGRCADRMAGTVRSGEGLERCLCVHAEINAIMHCAALGAGIAGGATLYTVPAPCLECSKAAVTAGIVRFVHMHEYPEDARDIVEGAGIETVRMDAGRVLRWLGAGGRRILGCAPVPGDGARSTTETH